MKNLFFLAIITFFCACSPDQDVINTLNGEWTSTARTKNGQNDLTPGDLWRFESCPNSSQSNCAGNYDYPSWFGTVTASFVYNVYNNGTQFSIDFGPNSVFTDVTDANIVEHTATKIRINFTDDGDYYEQTLEKK